MMFICVEYIQGSDVSSFVQFWVCCMVDAGNRQNTVFVLVFIRNGALSCGFLLRICLKIITADSYRVRYMMHSGHNPWGQGLFQPDHLLHRLSPF
jgi:hypothetical protein